MPLGKLCFIVASLQFVALVGWYCFCYCSKSIVFLSLKMFYQIAQAELRLHTVNDYDEAYCLGELQIIGHFVGEFLNNSYSFRKIKR